MLTASMATPACAQRSLLVPTVRIPCGRAITDPAATAERAQTMPHIRRYIRWRQRWTCPTLALVATVRSVLPEIDASSGSTGATARMFRAKMGRPVARLNTCSNASVLPAGSAPSVT